MNTLKGLQKIRFCYTLYRTPLTRHNRDCLERPQDPEGPQPRQIPHLHPDGGVAGGDHNEVEPVPRVAEVGVLVDDEPFGDDFDDHLRGVDREEDVSRTVELRMLMKK